MRERQAGSSWPQNQVVRSRQPSWFGRLLAVCNYPLSYTDMNFNRKRHMPSKESCFEVNNSSDQQQAQQVVRHTGKVTWKDFAVPCHSKAEAGRSVLQLLESGSAIPACCCWQQHFLVEYVFSHTPRGRAGHGMWCGVWTPKKSAWIEAIQPFIQVFGKKHDKSLDRNSATLVDGEERARIGWGRRG